jgi:hypothetical protein
MLGIKHHLHRTQNMKARRGENRGGREGPNVARANSNPCQPQEAVNKATVKLKGCMFPSRYVCAKLHRFPNQAFPILAG